MPLCPEPHAVAQTGRRSPLRQRWLGAASLGVVVCVVLAGCRPDAGDAVTVVTHFAAAAPESVSVPPETERTDPIATLGLVPCAESVPDDVRLRAHFEDLLWLGDTDPAAPPNPALGPARTGEGAALLFGVQDAFGERGVDALVVHGGAAAVRASIRAGVPIVAPLRRSDGVGLVFVPGFKTRETADGCTDEVDTILVVDPVDVFATLMPTHEFVTAQDDGLLMLVVTDPERLGFLVAHGLDVERARKTTARFRAEYWARAAVARGPVDEESVALLRRAVVEDVCWAVPRAMLGAAEEGIGDLPACPEDATAAAVR